jgi:two-component system, NtrC family, response regulator AtoC
MKTPLIGNSESIKRIRKLIKYVADTDLSVIITGESGVGKEVVVLHLVHESQRKDKPFIKVDCASLPGGLLESELFGFERGSFTDAYRKKRGKFELAHQGVIYLDEIGEMSPSLQSKLLHVLQSGEFAPLGSEKDVRSDVWVIAATNQDLEKAVKTGLFRKDLYYRLSTIKIHIPPLRDRPEDIPPLIDYYIEKYSSRFEGSVISKPSSYVMKKLIAYSWPGNVRELQNILQRFLVTGDWDKIIDDFYLESRSVAIPKSVENTFKGGPRVDVLLDLKDKCLLDHASCSLKNIIKETAAIVDKEVISSILDKTNWNRRKASKILKINYKTLLNKISYLDIKQQQEF